MSAALFFACKKDDDNGGSSGSNGVPTGEALNAALQGPPAWNLQSISTYDLGAAQGPFEPIDPADAFAINFNSAPDPDQYTTTGTTPREFGEALPSPGTYVVSGTVVRFNGLPLGPSVVYIDADSVVIRAFDLESDPITVYDLAFVR